MEPGITPKTPAPAGVAICLHTWTVPQAELLDMFGLPTTPIGLTDSGQIISRQKFIVGELPS
jgi:hypothetical protein